MSMKRFTFPLTVGVCAAVLAICGLPKVQAQYGDLGLSFFASADANKDGFLTRGEIRAAFAKWLAQGDTAKAGYLTLDQFNTVAGAAFPPSELAGLAGAGRGAAQPQTPKPDDVQRMMAALPAKAPAKPLQQRKILVLAKANGFVHSCIPLAAKTVEVMGTKTGAWTTTVSYDSAVITADNLKQYDVLFLDNTTGAFLDDPNNEAVTAARKKALVDFVRSGKGLVGVHAATDSYRRSTEAPPAAAARGSRGGGGGVGLAGSIARSADKDSDQKITAAELNALADGWFNGLDTEKAGRVSRQNFNARLIGVIMVPAVGRPGRDTQTGTWPEFNHMIGAYFKWHWFDPTHIVYKIDDPQSPLTAMFRGAEFSLDDETYTFAANSWSRENLHVLTSVNYAKMAEADKLKEDYPREDHDFGLSWIRREGNGRVFYEAHGHDEKIYAIPTMLEHMMAGIQYAAGDLKANDAPSKR